MGSNPILAANNHKAVLGRLEQPSRKEAGR
jgi:hypothetical protein